jgi:hypothetical protein
VVDNRAMKIRAAVFISETFLFSPGLPRASDKG